MKSNINKLLLYVLICAICMTTAVPAFAAEPKFELTAATNYLRKSGIMVGNDAGDMMLERNLTRAHLAAILTRMSANQEHFEMGRQYYANQCTFSDVPDWAKAYVGYCAVNQLVFGYGNGLYGAGNPVTPAAACTVMLRYLDEPEIEWDYHTACQTAISMGLAPAETLEGNMITRGNMAILLYRTMARRGFVPQADQPVTETDSAFSRNQDGSINIPSDGSQYIPQAGDVIRCDDGSNYTITDVSRYDKNMFADGPLPELPEPTCDWSLMPQPELPAAEARRFSVSGKDYLFVRNLYETRRMLYTLYNAIGSNDRSWQNGKPAVHPSGNPVVRISLVISNDAQAESFWPWRESEIVAPFNSNPAGNHALEAWDVYKDGVFLRTEYMVHHTS